MTTVASVSVRPGDPSNAKPDRDELEKAAQLLQDHGFKVKRVGRFAVSIEGESEAFKQELGVDLSSSKGGVAPAAPHDQNLADMLDKVEVTPEPSYF